MSLSAIRPFLRTRMNALGFTEWTDGFNFDNIPETILDKAYHISSPSADGRAVTMHDLQVDFGHEIEVFRKGFNDPAEAIDMIIEDMEDIICDLLDPEQRFDGHLNIEIKGFTLEPLNDENDNSVKATLSISVRVTLGVT